MSYGNEVYEYLRAEHGRRAQLHENAARHASCYLLYETIGVGEVSTPDPLVFDSPFLERPHVAIGSVLNGPPDLDLWHLPRMSASVIRWQRSDQGFYTGAWCYFTVDLEAREGVVVEAWPALRVAHHLTFSGVSYKAMPSVLRAITSSVAPIVPPVVP